MLIFSDASGLTVSVVDYTWDVGVEDFKCEIRSLSEEQVISVWEIVSHVTRLPGSVGDNMNTHHTSTSDPDEPYSCDIKLTCELDNRGGCSAVYTFLRFNWETWDDEDGTIKMTGRYRGPYD